VSVEAECPHAYEASCLTPQELNNAYFPGEKPDGPASPGEQQTVALIDAYNDLEAEHDLQVYDKEFSLPECTRANGCFEQANENGSTEPTSLPFPTSPLEQETEETECQSKKARESAPEREAKEAACKNVEEAEGWALETSTDIEVAHGICQNCRILLVEARSPEYKELETAEQTAAVKLGATEISNSWGGQAPPSDSPAFNHAGVVITAAAGDDGYLNWEQYSTRNKAGSPYFDGTDYPASSPHVVAVGGTSLTVGVGGVWENETVWNKGGGAGGGGCSTLPAQPWQQQDSEKVDCGGSRVVADVSADADPATGVAVYDSVPYPHETEPLDWVPVGGTSVASPMIASMFALAGGAHGVAYPAETLYSHLGTSALHDVTSGGNGKCDGSYSTSCSGSLASPLDCGVGAWICNATIGYDGPTGVGSPNGLDAFKVIEEGKQTSKSIEELGRSGGNNSSGGSENAGGTTTTGGGSSSGSTGGGATLDWTHAKPLSAPVRVSALALTAEARSAVRHHRPTVSQLAFSCTLSRAASERVTLALQIHSGKVHAGNHTRWRTLASSLTFAAIKGLNRRHLHGSAGLTPGIYRLTLMPTGGAARSITIRVL
jgi:subtilase family serine protease